MLIIIVTIDMLVAVAVFAIVVSVSRYISLGSILGAIAVPLTLVIRENLFHVNIEGYGTLLPFLIFVSLLVIYTHRKNVVRLINGNENKVNFSKNKTT